MTRPAGSLTTRVHTTAFGEPYNPPGANAGAGTPLIPDQRYGFTGRETTLSGMMYYRNRNYSPSLGRFTSPDPIGYEGGLNIYAYCGSDPVNRWDPMGLFRREMIPTARRLLEDQLHFLKNNDSLWRRYVSIDAETERERVRTALDLIEKGFISGWDSLPKGKKGPFDNAKDFLDDVLTYATTERMLRDKDLAVMMRFVRSMATQPGMQQESGCISSARSADGRT